MSSRTANLTALGGILLVAALYIYHTQAIQMTAASTTLGPRYFPNMLAAALVVLCIAAAIREFRAEIVHIEVPGKFEIAATVVVTGIYFALWQVTEQFYVATAAYFAALVLVYLRRDLRAKTVGLAAATALGFTLAVYVIFGLALDVRFH